MLLCNWTCILNILAYHPSFSRSVIFCAGCSHWPDPFILLLPVPSSHVSGTQPHTLPQLFVLYVCLQHDLRSFKLRRKTIGRPVKMRTLKIIHYTLVSCSVKEKAQLQIPHNIATYIEMLLYRSKNVRIC